MSKTKKALIFIPSIALIVIGIIMIVMGNLFGLVLIFVGGIGGIVRLRMGNERKRI